MRILDEAVTNAVKHAEARHISVTIETIGAASDDARGVISIADDGRGFALAGNDEAVPPSPAARGLRNMKSRAERWGAVLGLSSGPSGTRVRLQLPTRFPDSDTASR